MLNHTIQQSSEKKNSYRQQISSFLAHKIFSRRDINQLLRIRIWSDSQTFVYLVLFLTSNEVLWFNTIQGSLAWYPLLQWEYNAYPHHIRSSGVKGSIPIYPFHHFSSPLSLSNDGCLLNTMFIPDNCRSTSALAAVNYKKIEIT